MKMTSVELLPTTGKHLYLNWPISKTKSKYNSASYAQFHSSIKVKISNITTLPEAVSPILFLPEIPTLALQFS